jgi:hypothetical protein
VCASLRLLIKERISGDLGVGTSYIPLDLQEIGHGGADRFIVHDRPQW